MYVLSQPSLSERNTKPVDGSAAHRALRAGIVLAIGVLTLVGVALSPEPWLVAAVGFALAGIVILMWADDGPSVFLLPAAYQWSEVSVKPILTAVQSQPLQSFAENGDDLHRAAVFGLLGVVALAIGLRVGFGRQFAGQLTRLRDFLESTPPRKILLLSWMLVGFGAVVEAMTRFAGPATQIFLALQGAKLVGVFILVFSAFHFRRGYLWALALVGSQILIGMTGFFADFRGTLMTSLIAAFCARPVLRPSSIAVGIAGGLCVILIASFWSAYKPHYRDWVNGGTGAQIIARPLDERVEYLASYAGTFGAEEFGKGLDALLMRHSYIDFLAATMENVPTVVPHEDGRRLAAAVMHVFTPRVLFPNKPPVENDTDVTRKYSGVYILDDGVTSISIGYLGELYVDYGYYGALAAAFGIGLLIAVVARLALASRAEGGELAMAGFMMPASALNAFGTALIKVMGAVIMSSLVLIAFMAIGLPWILKFTSWLTPRKERPNLLYLPAPERRG